MYYPGGMKARVSPVQWSKPYSILAPTQDSNPGGRIQNHKRDVASSKHQQEVFREYIVFWIFLKKNVYNRFKRVILFLFGEKLALFEN